MQVCCMRVWNCKDAAQRVKNICVHYLEVAALASLQVAQMASKKQQPSGQNLRWKGSWGLFSTSAARLLVERQRESARNMHAWSPLALHTFLQRHCALSAMFVGCLKWLNTWDYFCTCAHPSPLKPKHTFTNKNWCSKL